MQKTLKFMNHLCAIVTALFFVTVVSAQTTNPTTTKEMQDKINQAQQLLDKLTPEQKKMMEQMGMSTTVPSMPGGITDADVKAAVNGDAFSVPSKNATLIAAIPKITLTAATLPAYIKAMNEYIEKGISIEAKQTAQLIYADYKSNKFSPEATGNAAVGIWATGQLETAVLIMGMACTDNVTDADLLCNFSAMLSMGGAPHKAIPLLEYLNKLYPDNTTILNNLGQAWFYLGEVDKANANLDKVVKAFAYHPQANYTQCLIEQSKGNTPKAIEKMKNSMAYSYSLDKLNMLRKLGYKVKGSDIRKPFRPNPNPLGLREFVRPDFPKNYDEEVQLKYVWDNFQKDIGNYTDRLNQQLQPYLINAQKKAAETYKMLGDKKGNVTLKSITSKKATAAAPTNLYEQNALRNLEDMDKDGGSTYRLKMAKKKIEDIIKNFQTEKDKAHKNFEKQFSVVATQETELGKKGENLGYDICKVNRAFSEWGYKNYNRPLQQAYDEYLHLLRLKIEEELYWKQFIEEEDQFAATQINAKKEWLAAISGRYLETAYITENNICEAPKPDKEKKIKLADFDDMHCQYHSELNFGFGNKFEFNCSKSSIIFDFKAISGNLHFKSGNDGKEKFVKGTVEATVINKEVSLEKGPVQAGAHIKAGIGMELSSKGIEDVYATGEAGVSAGSNTVSDPAGIVSDPSVSITASGRMSLISGNMSGGISGFGK